MHRKATIERDSLRVAGITARTSQETEVQTPRIPALWERWFGEELPKQLGASGPMFELYTDYASDHRGDYTAMLAVEAPASAELPAGVETRVLPAGTYAVFTSERGPVGEVVQRAWAEIWAMDEAELGGKRTYTADFEVFDERAADPANAQVDLYVAIG